MNTSFLVIVFLTVGSVGFAQSLSDSTIPDSSKKQIDFIFSLGGGVSRFMGDVQDQDEKVNVHLIGNRAVFDFQFGALLSKSFMVSANVLYGKLSGNENTFKQNRNFESNMLLAGIAAEYNFAGLYRGRLPVLNPFVNAGVYYGSYWKISTDLLFGDAQPYYYWSDGRIRDIAEDAPNSDDATLLSRDFEYESELVKGALHTFNVSAGFGLDLHLSRAVTMRLMSRYFFAVNDKVDGFSTGNAKGLNDGFFYNSLSLVFNAMAFSKNRKDELPNFKYLFDVSQLQSVETDDLDGDGVADIKDRCAATPPGIKVDKEGCPLDEDVDGIPDYRDKNTSSGKDDIVDQFGSPVDYELIAQKWTDSPDVYGISWDKKYDNPRFREDLGYTVNVDFVGKDDSSPRIQKVLRIPELRKEVLNDSLIVYRLGVYEKFEDVEEKRRELISDGIYSAYSVPENASMESVAQFTGIQNSANEAIVNSYGIAQSIRTIRTSSSAYRFPQLDYTISRFERYLYENIQEAALVEDYLQAISGFTWDKVVKQASDSVYGRLEMYPVSGKVKRYVSEILEERVETELESDSVGQVRKPDVDNTIETLAEVEIAESTVTERFTVSEIEKEVLNSEMPTSDREVSTESDDVQDIVPENTSTTKDEVENLETEMLKAQELKEAIEQIRSTSDLKKQPRINYAPVKPKFKDADLNNDGLISALEIQNVLEEILKGKSSFTSQQFNEMNEYFTDFTENVEPIDFGGTKVAFVNGVLTILKTDGDEYAEDSRRLLARKYKEADFNGDGELTSDEVQKMIDLFLKGGSSYSQERVHELIDLYFE
ncbi:MAG: hypothetical protein RL266_310 [Bacteroidota bacterium]|jgi:hypothetical protein